MSKKETTRREPPLDFIRTIVRDDLAQGRHPGGVVTRFPPEPNGFLHIGHAKSICLNFGVALEFGGRCNLRFDDTDPAKEDTLFVEAIKDNIRWLGFDWGRGLYNASDYFEELYGFAVQLIERGGAYVCSLSEAEIRETRGTVTEAGRESPYRNRSVDESVDLFTRMRGGEFPDGAHVLRARIDMASPNMKMRDPVVYRIRHVTHHHTGDAWPIYPMYDFAHPLSDALEGVTHSLCTLEFENNREFYDWILAQVDVPSTPRQIEFARLNLGYTVMSKRRLLELVEEGHVAGWDDPRMPTLAGLRRRGYTPEAIRNFCHSVGIAKSDNTVEMGQLEYFIRDDLNRKAPRVLAVERPLKVVLTNYPEGRVEELDAPYYPHDVPKEGSRTLPFSRELYIEQEDFLEEPPRGYHRLAPGREVRLRYAYIIRCDEVVKDPGTGEVAELRCSYDPETRSGSDKSGKKVQGTIQWVSAAHALEAELRLYDRLFSVPDPQGDPDRDYRELLNTKSLETVRGLVEPSLAGAGAGDRFQFERLGYFCVDPDSTGGTLVFNRIVTLRDSWLKIVRRGEGGGEPGRPRRAQGPAGKAARARPGRQLPRGRGIDPGPTLQDGELPRTARARGRRCVAAGLGRRPRRVLRGGRPQPRQPADHGQLDRQRTAPGAEGQSAEFTAGDSGDAGGTGGARRRPDHFRQRRQAGLRRHAGERREPGRHRRKARTPAGERRGPARACRRRRPRRQSRERHPLSRRQDHSPGVLRGPGDEVHQRQGRPPTRQRPAAVEAGLTPGSRARRPSRSGGRSGSSLFMRKARWQSEQVRLNRSKAASRRHGCEFFRRGVRGRRAAPPGRPLIGRRRFQHTSVYRELRRQSREAFPIGPDGRLRPRGMLQAPLREQAGHVFTPVPGDGRRIVPDTLGIVGLLPAHHRGQRLHGIAQGHHGIHALLDDAGGAAMRVDRARGQDKHQDGHREP